MKRNTLLLFVVAVLSAFAVPVSAQQREAVATASAVGGIGRPDVKPGDWWRYSYVDKRYGKPPCTYTLKVVGVTDEKIFGSTESPDGCIVTVGASPVYNRDFNLIPSDRPVLRSLDFPLAVGKSWRQSYDRNLGIRSYHYDFEFSVAGMESVQVKAGTFNAFKVIIVNKYHGTNANNYHWAGTVTETRWYVPELKNIAKRVLFDSGTSPSPAEEELEAYGTN